MNIEEEKYVREVEAQLIHATAEVERLQNERNAWEETAAQFARNTEFYRGLIHQIGEPFGVAAKTSDDGSVQEDTLALRVPELVSALRAANAELLKERDEWNQIAQERAVEAANWHKNSKDLESIMLLAGEQSEVKIMEAKRVALQAQEVAKELLGKLTAAEADCRLKAREIERVNAFRERSVHLMDRKRAEIADISDALAAAQQQAAEDKARVAELEEDAKDLGWWEAHPQVQIEFKSPMSMAESLLDLWPKGFWRIVFGRKDETNRFPTFRSAIRAARATGNPKEDR